MAEASGRLWISQADSDVWAADRVYDRGEVRSYCQVVAKCQQVVEKSVKAIAAGVRDRLVVRIDLGYGHEVSGLTSVLRRAAPPTDPMDVRHRINRLFDRFTVAEIKALESLAPRRPPPGSLHARNSEYPYERLAGDWTAPALDGFTMADVDRARALAGRVFTQARLIVSILRR